MKTGYICTFKGTLRCVINLIKGVKYYCKLVKFRKPILSSVS